MYLKLIILLVGLKLCHTANETFISSIVNDDELFDMLREKGKNYTNELPLLTEMYQNDSPNSTDEEWDKVLASLHSSNTTTNNEPLPAKSYQNDSPNSAEDEWDQVLASLHSSNTTTNNEPLPAESYQNDSPNNISDLTQTSNFKSDENIDDDLKNLLSLVGSSEVLNDAPEYSDEEMDEDPPYDEFVLPGNLEDFIATPANTQVTNESRNKEQSEDEPPYDDFILPDNLEDFIITTPENNQVTTESRDESFYNENFDEVSTTTENDHPFKLELITTEKMEFENDAEMGTDKNVRELNKLLNLDDSSNDVSGSIDVSSSIQLGTRFASPVYSSLSTNEEGESSEDDSEQNDVAVDANNVTQIVRLDDILNEKVDLKNKFPPKLYGKQASNQRSLAFVFDSTGSMWDDLEQLKGGAEKIMSAMEERDDNPIYNYILVPFHDPKVGPVTITNDKALFRQKLEEMEVYGGGDCPEMSLGGISMAIDASLPRSYIYVLTDATAADHILVGSILDKVLQKQIQVVFVLTGDCNNRTSPEYTVYEKIAAASSGQVFHLKKSDVNQVLDFVRKTLDSRRENLLVLTNVSPTNKSPHKVAIDSSLDQFTISVSGTNPKIDVVNPEGEHINEPPKVEQILDLENIQVINVNNPSNGSWKINVSSGSDHSIRLSGLTDLRIDHGFSVNVPKNMDETNHRPLHGQNTYLLLKPSNDTIVGQITSVDLIGLDGQPLRHNIQLGLLPGTNDTYISEKFKPPVSFFNLFIKGEDKNGNPFIRLTNTAIKTQFPEKPFVTVKVPEVYHLVHVPLNISCHVETLVPAKVQWFKNGKAVSDRLTKDPTQSN